MISIHQINAKIFKALCDENRLRIIEQLKSGEKCGCTLNEQLTINQSTLSHHMKILVESGIVEVRKDRKWSYYSLSDSGTQYVSEMVIDILKKDENAQNHCICEMETSYEKSRGK